MVETGGQGGPDVRRNSYIKPVCLLVLAVCGLLAVVGCASQTESRLAQAVYPSPSGASATSSALEPIQSLPEADMVQFFHFLLEMDDKPKTTLTKMQAEAVLPLVRQNVEKGTMNEDDKKAILRLFGDEQMAFYTRWANRGAAPEAGKPPESGRDGGLTDEEWQQWKQDWMHLHRADEARPDRPAPEASGSPGASISRSPDGADPGGWAAGEKNVEQLLMERLEQKIEL
ncbi:hypothetical protein [Paenibacillus sp. YN15]|uniref:hypothetical protein n=1 Tax=Paenibacillus sp. YN15 TaxID=1742774 RepID=UPI0011BF222E|nr:hypothetical protein [Paenibacillus sp. YN15]